MPEYDINRDQWGNPIERDRHAGSVWDTGPGTPGYGNDCGYPVARTTEMRETATPPATEPRQEQDQCRS